MQTILNVDKIEKYYGTKGNITKAIDNISFKVNEGEFLGIMGPSGSGKTTILNCISTIDNVTTGNIIINNKDITALKAKELEAFRRDELGFIFQDFNLLDTLTAYENIALALTIQKRKVKEIDRLINDVAKKLGINDILNQYPFQLSGGQKQRVACARALVTEPSLILADEPTGALDSKSSRLLLESFEKLNKEYNLTIIMITHDLGVVAETCDYVAVMYAGQVVEYADVRTLFKNPKHPYTLGLLNSLPRHDIDQDKLIPIKGVVPSPYEMPKGCRFAPRCPTATAHCNEKSPELLETNDNGQIRCWMYTDEWDGESEVALYGETRVVKS